MTQLYRSRTGRSVIRYWCTNRLAAWTTPHTRTTVSAGGTGTHAVTAGSGSPTVVFLPGTNMNAAASLPLLTALAHRGRTVALDLPGQPGLSSSERPPSPARLAWYGTWLTDALEALDIRSAVVLGHSLGAAVALSSGSPRIGRRVLLAPAGVTRLRTTPRVLAASAAWFLAPGDASSTRLLRTMLAPASGPPRTELAQWMTLAGRHVHTTADPGLAPPTTSRVPTAVAAGEHDTFLPPHRLAPAVRRRLGTHLEILPEAGHLAGEEYPARVAALAHGSGV
ncbi:alpha/beta fold hydrolase [Haloactinospora alba]|nr:alpha/beta hydrolase [Haloactinospora alba]